MKQNRVLEMHSYANVVNLFWASAKTSQCRKHSLLFFFLTKVAVPIAQQYAPKKDFIQDFSPLTKITTKSIIDFQYKT